MDQIISGTIFFSSQSMLLQFYINCICAPLLFYPPRLAKDSSPRPLGVAEMPYQLTQVVICHLCCILKPKEKNKGSFKNETTSSHLHFTNRKNSNIQTNLLTFACTHNHVNIQKGKIVTVTQASYKLNKKVKFHRNKYIGMPQLT